MKRFYAQAGVVHRDDGFVIALDGKAVRTPGGRTLLIRPLALAEAVAAEWQAQGETVRPETMPLTQLASTALDRVIPNRAAIIDQLMKYAGTDLLCYWADGPEDLVLRQERLWQPLVDWVTETFDVELCVTRGVIPVSQPEATLSVLADVLDRYDDTRLTALQAAVPAMGSLLLGVALVERRLDVEEAFAASQLDESYQIELWGMDAEALRARESLRNDIAAASLFIDLYVRDGMHLSY
ncbi:MAG TPA: ATP12 family protein [Telmatospirillum sp.]|nr:ATP12 family protein [Telmatospirillum sp.]